MNPDTISDLTLFNEKAKELANSSFAAQTSANNSGYILSANIDSGVDHVVVGPDQELVDAAFLTLRLFMQNNDRISIFNIQKLYDTDPKLAKYSNEFTQVRTNINTYLDSPNGVNFFENNYTNREIIEIFLWGSRAHVQKEKEVELNMLKQADIIFDLYLNQVNSAVACFIIGIKTLAEVNEKALS